MDLSPQQLEMPASVLPPEPDVVARLYGEPLADCPEGLFIPPEALRVFLESFEGPLDLLLYLIRKQKFDVMDIPMAELTEQYMAYVELIREHNLELAAAYLVMSATLMQIKSRLLLPVHKPDESGEVEDPRAELMRRLMEYERMRDLGRELEKHPRRGRDFFPVQVTPPSPEKRYPELIPEEVALAWGELVARLALVNKHKVQRQNLSVREHMSKLLKILQNGQVLTFADLVKEEGDTREAFTVWFMAMLELAKEGLVTITQAGPYETIYLEANVVRQAEMPNFELVPDDGTLF